MTDPLFSKERTVELLIEGAARIAATGNGLPLETFTALAHHVLDHLVSTRVAQRDWMRTQDADYLARMFQSVFANLQDTPMEIE